MAAKGLELIPGTTYLPAETDADFVAAALRLHAQPDLADAIRQAARRHVQRNHSLEAITGAVAKALSDPPPPVPPLGRDGTSRSPGPTAPPP